MAIIYQKDNRSGITYVYEAVYRWDKTKQQSRSKRTLIGRLNETSGEIVPTDGRNKNKHKDPAKPKPSKRGPKPSPVVKHQYYGATYLLDKISEQLGITADLQNCFPDTYKQILSIAYYLILEDSNPLYRFEKWHLTHAHPYGEDIPSPRSSDLFSSITDNDIASFCRLQGKRRIEKEYLAYDSTSISSYSDCLRQIQYGRNKEYDHLPQLNLLLVFGEESGLPFYYRKLAGNIPDVKTVKSLLAELDVLGLNKVKLVMDRGFYSVSNINGLLKEHLKFLVGVKTNVKVVNQALETAHESIRDFRNFNATMNTYGITVPTDWDYTMARPYKGDVIAAKKRVYLQLFHNLDKGTEDEIAFDKRIAALYNELQTDKRIAAHEKQYKQFFTVKRTPKRGIQIVIKEEELKKARRYFGYFALITNDKMDAFTALKTYRMKDVVEKAFGNIKERLNMRRLLVSSERSLEGKLFVEFIALILISAIHKQLQDAEIYKKYSMHQVLDKLDVIECFEAPGCKTRIGEVLKEQTDLYEMMGVKPLNSSCVG